MQLIAKLVEVLPVQTGEGRNGPWKKSTIIVETVDDRYPRKICVSIWGDKVRESDLVIGNMLDISFDVESREFNGKWYTDVKAWKVEPAKSQEQAPQDAAPQQYIHTAPPPPYSEGAVNTPPPFGVDTTSSNVDDLPF